MEREKKPEEHAKPYVPKADKLKLSVKVSELFEFSQRLYAQGHLSSDFAGGRCLNPEDILVAPVRPAEVSKGGIITGSAAQSDGRKPGQLCLAHIVAVLPYSPFVIWQGTECERELCEGDVIKAYEHFLEPVDHDNHSGLCSLPADKIRGVIFSREKYERVALKKADDVELTSTTTIEEQVDDDGDVDER